VTILSRFLDDIFNFHLARVRVVLRFNIRQNFVRCKLHLVRVRDAIIFPTLGTSPCRYISEKVPTSYFTNSINSSTSSSESSLGNISINCLYVWLYLPIVLL